MNNNFVNENSKLEYLNSFAAIFENELLLHMYNPRYRIDIETIQKIILTKKRILKLNLIFLFLGVVTIIFNFNFNEFYDQLFNITLLTFGTSLILIGLLQKKYRYKFILIKKDKETIEIRIENNNLKEVKAIIKIMTKKLKKLHINFI